MSIESVSTDDLFSLTGFLPFGEHIDEGPYYLPHDGGSLFSGASPYMEAGLLTQRPHEDFFNNASVRALIKPQDDPFWTGNSKMKTATPIDDIHLAGALGNRPSGASLTIASSDLYPGYHTFQVPTSSTQDSISIGSGQLGQMACIESPSFDVDTFFEPGQGGSTHDHQDTSDNYEFTDTKFQHPHDPRSETHGHGQQRKLHRARSRSPVVCQTCGTKSKNPSDARKHQQTHSRDFVCDLSDCNRNGKGFGNIHDLVRHKRCVHGLHGGDGYVCVICLRNASGKRKKKPRFWSRKDNMKAHVQRMHKRELSLAQDPDRLIEHTLEESRVKEDPNIVPTAAPSTARSESSMRTDAIHDSEFVFTDGTNSLSPALANHQGLDDALMCMPANQPNQQTLWPSSASSTGAPLLPPQCSTYILLSSDGCLPAPDQAQRKDSAPEQGNTHVPECQSADDVNTVDAPRVTSPHAVGSSAHHMTIAELSTPASKQLPFVCAEPGCNRDFLRACELRKHEKRHTRPYACTFPKCPKNLGSRDDWRRHESTQHFLSSKWLCRHPMPDGASCGHHVFNDCWQFRMHLQDVHKIHESDTLTDLDHKYHLGREGNYSFWCGFCSGVIIQDDDFEGVLRPWEARCAHILNHFDREDCSIADWVDVDTGLPRREITRKQLEARSRSGKEVANEEVSRSLNDHVISPGTPPSVMCAFESIGDFDAMMDWTEHGEVI